MNPDTGKAYVGAEKVKRAKDRGEELRDVAPEVAERIITARLARADRIRARRAARRLREMPKEG